MHAHHVYTASCYQRAHTPAQHIEANNDADNEANEEAKEETDKEANKETDEEADVMTPVF